MAYFKINNTDYSPFVSSLKVSKAANYNAQTNAAGDTVVDYINHKKTVEVEIIALDDDVMKNIQGAIAQLAVSVEFLNPHTGALSTINCIIPENEVEYYTIQANKVMFNAFTLTFIEL